MGDEKKDVTCHLHGGQDRHQGDLLPENTEDVRLQLNKEIAEETVCEKEVGARFGDCPGKGGKDGGTIIVGGGEQATKDSTEKELQEKMPEEVVDQAGDGVVVGEEGEEEGRKRGISSRGDRRGRKGRQRSFSNSHRFGSI